MEDIQTGFRGHILINKKTPKNRSPSVRTSPLPPKSQTTHQRISREYLTRAHIKRNKKKEWRGGDRRMSESYWNACLRFKVPGGGLTFYSWTVSIHRQAAQQRTAAAFPPCWKTTGCARRLPLFCFTLRPTTTADPAWREETQGISEGTVPLPLNTDTKPLLFLNRLTATLA